MYCIAQATVIHVFHDVFDVQNVHTLSKHEPIILKEKKWRVVCMRENSGVRNLGMESW